MPPAEQAWPGVSCFASAHTPPLPVLPGSQTESHRSLIQICFPGVAASLCVPTVRALRLYPSFSCHPTLTHRGLKPNLPELGPSSSLGACRGLEILLTPLPHESKRRHELEAFWEQGLRRAENQNRLPPARRCYPPATPAGGREGGNQRGSPRDRWNMRAEVVVVTSWPAETGQLWSQPLRLGEQRLCVL